MRSPAVDDEHRDGKPDRRTALMGLSVAVGAGVGTAIGVSTGQVALWLAIGIAAGVALASFIGTARPGAD
jgi:hypothetical protein